MEKNKLLRHNPCCLREAIGKNVVKFPDKNHPNLAVLTQI